MSLRLRTLVKSPGLRNPVEGSGEGMAPVLLEKLGRLIHENAHLLNRPDRD